MKYEQYNSANLQLKHAFNQWALVANNNEENSYSLETSLMPRLISLTAMVSYLQLILFLCKRPKTLK